jgi:N-acetylmuramoyl-L-alanine amidase
MASPTVTLAATGQEIVTLALNHLGEPYVLGAPVPKDNPSWHGPWNCAEFASWVHYQVGGLLYGCNSDVGNPSIADAYTGYWDRDAKTLGEIVSVNEAARTAGAAILRVPSPGATGHIVISDGTGGTVEAHSHADGVISSTLANRRWDFGILVPFISYSSVGPEVSVESPSTTVYRLTAPPMEGVAIREIQLQLKKRGFDPGLIDGKFGPHTHAAVIAFQLSKGMTPDGEVGPLTAGALVLKKK